MTGLLRATASLVVLFIAGLAALMVFDIVPMEFFGESVKKLVLLGLIVVLAGAALGFIMRLGK